MKGKIIFSTWLLVLLLLAVSPVAAQEESSFVFVPGWVAWTMVVVSLVGPGILYVYLKKRGRL